MYRFPHLIAALAGLLAGVLPRFGGRGADAVPARTSGRLVLPPPPAEPIPTDPAALTGMVEALRLRVATLEQDKYELKFDLRQAEGDRDIAREEAKSMAAVVERDRMRVRSESADFAANIARKAPTRQDAQ